MLALPETGYTDLMKRFTGKVKWFSHDHQRGALASIGGTNVLFSTRDLDSGAASFSAGQLVSYADEGSGSLEYKAVAVRPAGTEPGLAWR